VVVAQGHSAGEAGARSTRVQGHGGEAGERGHRPARASGEGGEARRAPRATQGGEGESGEGANRASASAQLPSNLRLHRDVQLVRGHLLVGSELAKAGDWDKAMPHLLHPQQELYGGMRDRLTALKTPPLLPSLRALARAAKSRN